MLTCDYLSMSWTNGLSNKLARNLMKLSLAQTIARCHNVAVVHYMFCEYIKIISYSIGRIDNYVRSPIELNSMERVTGYNGETTELPLRILLLCLGLLLDNKFFQIVFRLSHMFQQTTRHLLWRKQEFMLKFLEPEQDYLVFEQAVIPYVILHGFLVVMMHEAGRCDLPSSMKGLAWGIQTHITYRHQMFGNFVPEIQAIKWCSQRWQSLQKQIPRRIRFGSPFSFASFSNRFTTHIRLT